MTGDEKVEIWKKEAEDIFVGPVNSIYLESFVNGYIAAYQKNEKLEARIKELTEGIEDILNESTLSYVVERRLRRLIEKR
jgi:hypothetical protein